MSEILLTTFLKFSIRTFLADIQYVLCVNTGPGTMGSILRLARYSRPNPPPLYSHYPRGRRESLTPGIKETLPHALKIL